MGTSTIAILILGLICITIIIVISRRKHHQWDPVCDPILAQLKSHGDNHSLARIVDHWVYFKSKTDLDNFIDEISKMGFVLLTEQIKDDEKGYNYAVNIEREEKNIIRENIIRTVIELQMLVKKHNGDYDGWGCPIQE